MPQIKYLFSLAFLPCAESRGLEHLSMCFCMSPKPLGPSHMLHSRGVGLLGTMMYCMPRFHAISGRGSSKMNCTQDDFDGSQADICLIFKM